MYVQEGDLEGLFDLRDNDIASHAQRNIAVNTRRICDKIIKDITADSREVREGSLFICLKGAHVDGHKYLEQAAASGAGAALVEDVPEVCPDGLTLLKVADTRLGMEVIAPFFYDYPGKTMRMIGVTGTNGKTTTTNIVRAILRKAGFKVGLIGTINIMIEDEAIVAHNTTPDVVDLQRALYRMKEAGCEYVVMEVSSHALALNRVAGCEYDTAALTNITQDHLDFHKTLENYRDAKGLLFEHLPKDVIMIFIVVFKVEAKQMRLQLHTPVGEMDLLLKITGEFNVYNVMAAVAIALAEQIDKKTIVDVLNGFDGVPGRFQLVEAGQPYTVIVDYAHTPDGLENVLKTARSITEGKLWVVFGCGGDRDNKKRPIMGRIALELADRVVVTSDNPRTEDPAVIIDEIAEALKDVPEGKSVELIAERRDAIYHALSEAAANDVIMIAGKGHENYQILADKTIHFDDREVVQEYWKKR